MAPVRSSQDSECRILSVLQLITKITRDLVSHLHSTAESLLHDIDLLALITSAFNDLLKCVNIVNTQAPISRLPADILGLIFQNVHHDEIQIARHPLSRKPWYHWHDPRAHFQCPLTLSLSHVSRSWYDLVHNSPFLWTTVDIYYPWNPSLLDLFLARSKSCPLYLNIVSAECCVDDHQRGTDFRAGGNNDAHDNINFGVDRFCDALVPHIPRCRSISILTDKRHDFLSEALHRRFRDLEAPFLEQLFLQIPRHHSESHSQIFTLGAPLLSYLHFNLGGISRWHPPFASLTSLHLQMDSGLRCSEFVAVVAQCPLLETLAMYDVFVFDQLSMQITLPHLRSLQLYGNNLYVADILLGISAPVLESLVITPFHWMDVEALRSSHLSGPKKFTAVTSITLAPFHGLEAHVDVLLRSASECFPNVIDVTLLATRPGVLRAVADGLADTDVDIDGDMIFPNMRSLALRDISPHFEPSLNRLISHRISGGKPLQTLYLDKDSMKLVADLQWLHDNVEVVELDKWSILRTDSLICDEEDDRFYPPQD